MAIFWMVSSNTFSRGLAPIEIRYESGKHKAG
jgi:hypothetical protein